MYLLSVWIKSYYEKLVFMSFNIVQGQETLSGQILVFIRTTNKDYILYIIQPGVIDNPNA